MVIYGQTDSLLLYVLILVNRWIYYIQWTGRERSIIECGKEDICQKYQLGKDKIKDNQQTFFSHLFFRGFLTLYCPYLWKWDNIRNLLHDSLVGVHFLSLLILTFYCYVNRVIVVPGDSSRASDELKLKDKDRTIKSITIYLLS